MFIEINTILVEIKMKHLVYFTCWDLFCPLQEKHHLFE